MPIYEFQCRTCGEISEFLTGVIEDQDISCRNCGSRSMERVLSAPSLLNQSVKRHSGHTCCGREERCTTPPCSSGGECRRE